MKTLPTMGTGEAGGPISARAKARMQAEGGPLLVEDWARILFVHYEVEPAALQPQVPFELDTWEGRAFVSLTAFYGHGLRPVMLGEAGRWLAKPGQFPFILNVRTYVHHEGQPGIHFLAEWIPNAFAAAMGRMCFGLPFRKGRLDYRHGETRLDGRIDGRRGRLRYAVELPQDPHFETAARDSRDEWLLERYVAFTAWRGCARFFRVWHPAWPQIPVEAHVLDDSLLHETGPWFAQACRAGAHYSPGFFDVHMGRPWRVHPDRFRLKAGLPTPMPACS